MIEQSKNNESVRGRRNYNETIECVSLVVESQVLLDYQRKPYMGLILQNPRGWTLTKKRFTKDTKQTREPNAMGSYWVH